MRDVAEHAILLAQFGPLTPEQRAALEALLPVCAQDRADLDAFGRYQAGTPEFEEAAARFAERSTSGGERDRLWREFYRAWGDAPPDELHRAVWDLAWPVPADAGREGDRAA
jgi:hypothetical protein